MPGTKLRLEASGKRCFLHPLVDLEQVRVGLTNADPNDFRRAFRWKSPDGRDRQEKCAELDLAEFFTQREIDIIRDIAEESERQVHLLRISPAHAANLRIKSCKESPC